MLCKHNIRKGLPKVEKNIVDEREKERGAFYVFFDYGGSYFEPLFDCCGPKSGPLGLSFRRIISYSGEYFYHPSGEAKARINYVFAHAPNAAATSVSNRFAVSAPAAR